METGSPLQTYNSIMKVAIAQINPTVGDISGNVRKIIDFGKRAQAQQAQLVIFPEMAVCGYPPMDLLLKDSLMVKLLLTSSLCNSHITI